MFTDSVMELHTLLPPKLMQSCKEVQIPKGTRMFEAGQPPEHMFFIVSGEVVLERPGLQGSSVILQRTRRGFFSEASLKSARYHCHGLAMAKSKVIQIPVQDIRDALDIDLAFSGRWIDMLNKEVKRLRLQCERLSMNKVQDRFIHLLETEGTNGQYPIGAGTKSLASELGVSHEALYRCIYSMENDGLLSRDQGCFHLSSKPIRPTLT